MRTILTCALVGWVALVGCGSDEGIIVSASTDPSVGALDQLRFLIGVDDGAGVFVKDEEQQPDVIVSVAGRSLASDPYDLLLRDGGDGPDPSRVLVAVVGSADGAPAAFGAFDAPQTFMPGKVIRRDVVLAADAGFDLTDTGCVSWDGLQIVDPSDRDCDNDPAVTDCDDNDPARSSMFPEVCDNGIDDDCDMVTDETPCGGECSSPADCETANGPAPCGEWQCNAGSCDVVCPDCTDADLDGYGVGTGCAGPDCDDADDTFFDSGQRACYSGPDGTSDSGACRPGVQTCVDGVLGPCTGEVTPSGEACNAEDDDCDGSIDEALGTFTCGLGECVTSVAACTGGSVGVCVAPTGASSDSDCDGLDDDCDGAIDEDCPTCVRVTTPGNGGNDAAAIGDGNATPFATIQGAIDWAEADGTRPRIVCVAPGAACGATATFSGEIEMADGISVLGNYRSSDFLRCSGSTTNVATGVAEGVVFPSGVTSPTVLDGVRIVRAPTPTTAGITVEGATGAIISNVTIEPIGATVTNSYGVDLKSNAEALITGSRIHAGTATVQAAGVRAVQATPIIRDNCASLNGSGRCDDNCSTAADPGIRAKFFPLGVGESYGVLLEDSPEAVVDTTAFCGGAVDTTAAVRITGKASSVIVRANNVQQFGGVMQAYGVWADDCEGDAPWIVDNHNILAAGEVPTSLVAGVKAIGDCHPVIDSNVRITGGAEGGTVGANGVHCASDGTTASRCVVLGNQQVQGSAFGFPPTAVGIRCDDGACMRIAGNSILGNTGQASYGIWLERTGAFIDDNDIVGGCPNTTEAVGVHAVDAWARLQNNRIAGGACEGASGLDFIGLRAVVETPGVELDVHSNTIDARGFPTGCRGVGVALDIAAGAAVGPLGVFRNNIVLGGDCATSIGVEELSHPADPRVFENNDLDPYNTPNALYMDEGSNALTSAAAVNALTDATVGGNISAPSQFVSYPGNLHLTSGSMCIGAGTPVGAPAVDMDGDARDAAAPDIGADEFVP